MAHLVFNQPKFLLTVAVGLRLSQVVRSTALGVLFPELPGYSAPCPRLLMSPRLLRFRQSGYVQPPPSARRLSGFPVLPRYTLSGGASTKLV